MAQPGPLQKALDDAFLERSRDAASGKLSTGVDLYPIPRPGTDTPTVSNPKPVAFRETLMDDTERDGSHGDSDYGPSAMQRPTKPMSKPVASGGRGPGAY